MHVQEILTVAGQKRYVVIDDNGLPVEAISKYLKYLDTIGRARRTLSTYAYNLLLYFRYLKQRELDYLQVSIDDLGQFVLWLKNPYQSVDLFPTKPTEQARENSTINLIITTVSGFYDYLWRSDAMPSNLNDKMRISLPLRGRVFKNFLYHALANRNVKASILRQKTPRTQPKTITKTEIESLIAACRLSRDKLLIHLLYGSSIRIGEALALWMEDIDIVGKKIHIRDRGPLQNDAEIKTPASCRTIHISDDLLTHILNYIAVAHTDEVETNHLFIKSRGQRAGEPLSYPEVSRLFLQLRKKTKIAATPHILRHTSLTELARAGWKPELLQNRAGHANFQTTYQMYVHPTDEDIRQDWERTKENIRLKQLNKSEEQ